MMAASHSHSNRPQRTAFFSPLPTHGIWTAVDLTRGQFFWILLASVLLFVFLGGPVWLHARESHFVRITLSYIVIVPAVAVALWHNHKFHLTQLVVGSAIISFAKLAITAALLIIIGVAR